VGLAALAKAARAEDAATRVRRKERWESSR